jgi:hypothetical protein
MYASFAALLVLALLQSGQATGDLKFRPPQGWQHQALKDGRIVVRPPDVPDGKECSVLLVPAAEGDLDQNFNNAWQRVAGATKVVRRGKAVSGKTSGGFDTRSMSALMDEAGARNHVNVFAVGAGTKVRMALFMANDEELFNERLPDVKAMLDSVYLAKAPPVAPEPAPTRPPAPEPGPAPAKQKGQGFEGVYYFTQVEFNPLGGRGATFRKIDYMCFFPDGRVYWGQPIGGPVEIFENEYESPYFGRYTMNGDEFTIVWGYDKVLNQQLTHNGKRHGSGGVEVNGLDYRRMHSCEGLKLHGTYVWKWDGGDSVVRFTKDGRFTERGLKHTVADDELGRPDWPKLPESGAGTYSIRKNTLEVKYDRGPTRRIFFSIPDPEDAKTISINNYPHDREH